MVDEVHVAEDRLSDFTRDKRIIMLSAMAVVIGAMSALVAKILIWLINVITNISFFQTFSSASLLPETNHLGLVVIVVPAIGGLLIGLMARYGSDKIRGHGIPEALEAILFGRSRMGIKVALLKPLSSAISIGSGGPFGAEGPIIMTGGAIGSLFAQLFHLSSAERKTLLVAGAAGGMAAVFAAPVAAVLLAVELLLFEWRPRSFIPVAISASMAAALRVPLMGVGPIFPVTPHAALGAEGLLAAFIAGIVAGLASGALTALVYGCEDIFTKLPIHWMWWPAIGGLFVGIGGYFDPRVLGVGYDTIHALLQGHIVGMALISLLVIKALVWAIALGSGTSGGVLAPLLIMGGALGAAEAGIIPIGDTAIWATVSMAAIMGGTMRSPLTALVFALELTHDLNLMPALLLGCVAAHAVTVLLLRRSILTEKVARRGYHVAREYSVDPLAVMRVRDVMDVQPPTVPAALSVTELAARIARHDPQVSRRQGTLLLDEEQRLVGIITRGDMVRAMERQPVPETAADAGTRELVITYPDELLQDALTKMVQHDVGRLPVVSRADPRHLVGYLGRADIMAAHLRHLEDEQEREAGLIRRPASVPQS